MQIDRNFPGGNIIVDSLNGNHACVRQDYANSSEWWFYWQMRITGAAGQSVTLEFPKDRPPFTSTGPVISVDGQKTWRSLGRAGIHENVLTIAIPDKADEVYVSFSIPYVRSDLDRFLSIRPAIKSSVLCKDRSGADVPLIQLSASSPRYNMLLTARHHACEGTASYVIEGFFDYCLTSPEWHAGFLKEMVNIYCVPLVDYDGVQAGDQGKLRIPHDHNRDYGDKPLYPTVAAIQDILNGSLGKQDIFMDIHCPWIWYGRNEEVFIVGMPEPMQQKIDLYREILRTTQTGTLIYNPQQDCPFGVEWNTGRDASNAEGYAMDVAQVPLVFAWEIPYGIAGGKLVTAGGLRLFGRDIARATAIYLQEHGQ